MTHTEAVDGNAVTWGRTPGVTPALSLRQPWAWAILHAGKTIENRTAWKGCAYRGPVWIHAAKGCTRKEYAEAETWMSDRGLPRPDGPFGGFERGGIVGRARIVGTVHAPPGRLPLVYGSPFAPARSLTDAERAWWTGGFALVLADVEAVPFTRCRGALGLFTPERTP